MNYTPQNQYKKTKELKKIFETRGIRIDGLTRETLKYIPILTDLEKGEKLYESFIETATSIMKRGIESISIELALKEFCDNYEEMLNQYLNKNAPVFLKQLIETAKSVATLEKIINIYAETHNVKIDPIETFIRKSTDYHQY